MDLRLVLSTFAAVFAAEFGDKTQLATFALAAGARSRVAVFVGAALALVAAAGLAVLAAEVLARRLDPRLVHRLAGAVFVAVGIWMLLAPPAAGPRSPASATAAPARETAG